MLLEHQTTSVVNECDSSNECTIHRKRMKQKGITFEMTSERVAFGSFGFVVPNILFMLLQQQCGQVVKQQLVSQLNGLCNHRPVTEGLVVNGVNVFIYKCY